MAAHTFCHLAILSVVFDCKPEPPELPRFPPMCRPNPTEDVEVPTSDEMKSPLGRKEGSAFLKEMR